MNGCLSGWTIECSVTYNYNVSNFMQTKMCVCVFQPFVQYLFIFSDAVTQQTDRQT